MPEEVLQALLRGSCVLFIDGQPTPVTEDLVVRFVKDADEVVRPKLFRVGEGYADCGGLEQREDPIAGEVQMCVVIGEM